MFLGVEILDRLVVEQAVDGLGVGVGIGLVHRAANGDAPFGDGDREPAIEEDGRHRGEGEPDVEIYDEDDADERELKQRRENRKEREREQRVDALGAALDDAVETAGALFQMEAQRQCVDVPEGLDRDLAHRTVGDLGEDGVAKLGEGLHQNARDAVGQDEAEGYGEALIGGTGLKRIDRPGIHERDDQGDDLGQNKQEDGEHHPAFEPWMSSRPDIGPKRPNGAPAVFLRGGGRLNSHFDTDRGCAGEAQPLKCSGRGKISRSWGRDRIRGRPCRPCRRRRSPT